MFDIDVSMITVSSVEATSASAILIAFSATGSGLSMSTISGSSTQVTGPLNQEFMNKGLSYTVSSLNANVAEDFSVTLELGAAKAEEGVALASFKIALTGSTIVATAAAVTTCSASADYADSATPTCSGSVCVAMPCGGGSFTPDGAYDSLWDSVKPMTGFWKCCPEVCVPPPGIVVSTSVLHLTWQWITSSTSCACLLSVTRLSQTN